MGSGAPPGRYVKPRGMLNTFVDCAATIAVILKYARDGSSAIGETGRPCEWSVRLATSSHLNPGGICLAGLGGSQYRCLQMAKGLREDWQALSPINRYAGDSRANCDVLCGLFSITASMVTRQIR